MKTLLFFSCVFFERRGIGLYPFERHLIDGPFDLRGQGAFLLWLQDPRQAICLVLPNPVVSSVNHELSGPVSSDSRPRGGDGFLLSRKGLAGLAFLLYRPGTIETIYVDGFREHNFILRL
jgi:hypothetical protein